MKPALWKSLEIVKRRDLEFETKTSEEGSVGHISEKDWDTSFFGWKVKVESILEGGARIPSRSV